MKWNYAVLAIACATLSFAGPVDYATYLAVEGVQSQFVNPADTRTISTGQTLQIGQADLSQGALRTRNQRTSGTGGLATQVLFYDTITFDGSAFEGAFGATYDLTLTATYEGTFSASGTIDSGGTGGRIHVYSGDTDIDSGVFADANSLTNFMFIGGPTPLCANGVNGPDFSTHRGFFTFDVSCTVTVNALNPTVRILMNLPTFINAGVATWDLNMMNTATISLGDLGGRTVYSASGVLPGTADTDVPEPGTFLIGFALIGLGLLWRRRADLMTK